MIICKFANSTIFVVVRHGASAVAVFIVANLSCIFRRLTNTGMTTSVYCQRYMEDFICTLFKHLSFCGAARARLGAVNWSEARNCTENHSKFISVEFVLSRSRFFLSLRSDAASPSRIPHIQLNMMVGGICIRLKQCVLKWL